MVPESSMAPLYIVITGHETEVEKEENKRKNTNKKNSKRRRNN